MKIDTWCPVFSGFYGTIWETEGDEEMEIENVNEKRKEKGKEPITWDDVTWDYEGYMDKVSRGFVKQIEKELKTLGLVSAVTFQELWSPREYNFGNDSINISVTLTKQHKKKIADYLRSHTGEFAKYIREHYKGYPGFISFYSNDAANWLSEEALEQEHKLGSILNFILLNENSDLETDIHETLHGNGYYLQVANYSELTGETI